MDNNEHFIDICDRLDLGFGTVARILYIQKSSVKYYFDCLRPVPDAMLKALLKLEPLLLENQRLSNKYYKKLADTHFEKVRLK